MHGIKRCVSTPRLLASLLGLMMIVSGAAAANMANPYAPQTVGAGPFVSPPPNAIVVSEELRFTWTAQDACTVRATYVIRAHDAAAPTRYAFFWPNPKRDPKPPMKVYVNGLDTPTSRHRAGLSHLERFIDKPRVPQRQREIDRGELAVSTFSVALKPGDNVISVEYVAMVGWRTRGLYPLWTTQHSLVGYAAWPLKSWTLADDFVLEVVVEVWRDAAFRDNLLGPPPVEIHPIGDISGEIGRGRVVYRHRFDRDFPDDLGVVLNAGTFE